MITKTFEIRDRLTFIPVIATLLEAIGPAEPVDNYLLGRAGYISGNRSVLVTKLVDSKSASDPHDWDNGARTMPIAHQYIQEKFLGLESGAVIDVEYILGERKEPKVSEREAYP